MPVRTLPKLLNADRGIIIAADVATIDDLQELANLGSLIDEVVAIKVGFPLSLRYGLPVVVRAVNDTCDLPVIYDHQKAGTDIPSMGKPFAEICRSAGVRGVIFFPQAGPRTLEGFVERAIESELCPIVGLVMTHPAYLQSEGGFIADDAPARICEIAIELGVRTFVLPGTKIDITRKLAEGCLVSVRPAQIMMPGVGTQGGAITAAFEAVNGHHPFVIIGSAIYNAPDRLEALRQFAAEI